MALKEQLEGSRFGSILAGAFYSTPLSTRPLIVPHLAFLTPSRAPFKSGQARLQFHVLRQLGDVRIQRPMFIEITQGSVHSLEFSFRLSRITVELKLAEAGRDESGKSRFRLIPTKHRQHGAVAQHEGAPDRLQRPRNGRVRPLEIVKWRRKEHHRALFVDASPAGSPCELAEVVWRQQAGDRSSSSADDDGSRRHVDADR